MNIRTPWGLEKWLVFAKKKKKFARLQTPPRHVHRHRQADRQTERHTSGQADRRTSREVSDGLLIIIELESNRKGEGGLQRAF